MYICIEKIRIKICLTNLEILHIDGLIPLMEGLGEEGGSYHSFSFLSGKPLSRSRSIPTGDDLLTKCQLNP